MEQAQVCYEGEFFAVLFANWDGEVGTTDVYCREKLSTIKVVQTIVDTAERVIVTNAVVV